MKKRVSEIKLREAFQRRSEKLWLMERACTTLYLENASFPGAKTCRVGLRSLHKRIT